MKITGAPAFLAFRVTRLIRSIVPAQSNAAPSPSQSPCCTSMTRTAVVMSFAPRDVRSLPVSRRRDSVDDLSHARVDALPELPDELRFEEFPGIEFADDPQRLPAAVRACGIAWKLLVGHVGI